MIKAVEEIRAPESHGTEICWPAGVLQSERIGQVRWAKREETTSGSCTEETEEQRIADMPAAAKHRFVDHILGLLAGTFSRRSETR